MEDEAIMLTQPSHGTIVKTRNGESTYAPPGYLKHTSFFVKAARCPALILGDPVGVWKRRSASA